MGTALIINYASVHHYLTLGRGTHLTSPHGSDVHLSYARTRKSTLQKVRIGLAISSAWTRHLESTESPHRSCDIERSDAATSKQFCIGPAYTLLTLGRSNRHHRKSTFVWSYRTLGRGTHQDTISTTFHHQHLSFIRTTRRRSTSTSDSLILMFLLAQRLRLFWTNFLGLLYLALCSRYSLASCAHVSVACATHARK